MVLPRVELLKIKYFQYFFSIKLPSQCINTKENNAMLLGTFVYSQNVFFQIQDSTKVKENLVPQFF